MNILITGGAGFIGSNLANYHLAKEDNVIVIDNLSTGSIKNIQQLVNLPNFTFYQEDIVTWKGLGKLLKEIDRIYHLAAVVGMFNVISEPVKTLQVNGWGTLRLFEHIVEQKVKPQVLVASSSEVYGNQQGVIEETTPIVLENSSKNHASYASSKLFEESVAFSYHKKYNIPATVLRIFNTIGRNQTGQYGMVVPRFVKHAVKNEDLTIYGDGTQQRSFCDVRDLVVLLDKVAENKGLVGYVINVGKSDEISIYDLANRIKTLSHSRSALKYIPFSEVYQDEYLFIKKRLPSVKKLLDYTSYHYKWTLEETLKDLILHENSLLQK